MRAGPSAHRQVGVLRPGPRSLLLAPFTKFPRRHLISSSIKASAGVSLRAPSVLAPQAFHRPHRAMRFSGLQLQSAECGVELGAPRLPDAAPSRRRGRWLLRHRALGRASLQPSCSAPHAQLGQRATPNSSEGVPGPALLLPPFPPSASRPLAQEVPGTCPRGPHAFLEKRILEPRGGETPTGPARPRGAFSARPQACPGRTSPGGPVG